MSQESQPDTPSEEDSSCLESPFPDGEELSNVPPSKFLYAYLQQRADSLYVTQSDLEDLLETGERYWILTSGPDRSREFLTEATNWSVDTLGEIRSDNLLLLRVHDEGDFDWNPIRIEGRPGLDFDELLIVSAAVVRFPQKMADGLIQQVDPMFIVESSDSHAFAVLIDNRYHVESGIAVIPQLALDVGDVMYVGSWLNEVAEEILVDRSLGKIVDYRLKDKEEILATVTDNPADTDSSDQSIGIRVRTQSHRISIGLATVALVGLLALDVASISLSDPVVNGIGLAAFGVLIGAMIHGDLKDG